MVAAAATDEVEVALTDPDADPDRVKPPVEDELTDRELTNWDGSATSTSEGVGRAEPDAVAKAEERRVSDGIQYTVSVTVASTMTVVVAVMGRARSSSTLADEVDESRGRASRRGRKLNMLREGGMRVVWCGVA